MLRLLTEGSRRSYGCPQATAVPPLFNTAGKGNLRDYTKKTYDVDHSGPPESYFEMLAVAFNEHIPVAKEIGEILNEAVANVKDN